MMAQRVDVNGAAAYVGLSKHFLNELRVRGGGPIYAKISRRVVYDLADLDIWMESHKVNSTSQTPAPARRRRQTQTAARKQR